MGRSGVVQLRSGRWEWSLREASQGSTVVFRHWDRGGEELRNWVPTRELTGEDACEAARDAAIRSWVDAYGVRWRVTLEPAWAWSHSQDATVPGEGGEEMWLVYSAPGRKVRVPVRGDTRLGELTGDVLSRLLNSPVSRC